jgi:hypothetical protein
MPEHLWPSSPPPRLPSPTVAYQTAPILPRQCLPFHVGPRLDPPGLIAPFLPDRLAPNLISSRSTIPFLAIPARHTSPNLALPYLVSPDPIAAQPFLPDPTIA